MVDKPTFGGLRGLINRLLSQITLLDLEKRKQAYRPQAREISDIGAILNRNIDRIASQASPAASRSQNHSPHRHTEDKPRPVRPGSSPVEQFSEVAEYFKSRAASPENGDYMGHRLVRSTWEHIHTALLQARQGDLTNARLHAGIASQAMKEASHYMDDETFEQFASDIAAALEKLDKLDEQIH